MSTHGKNTVISLCYKGQEHEIYYIPETFEELEEEIQQLKVREIEFNPIKRFM